MAYFGMSQYGLFRK